MELEAYPFEQMTQRYGFSTRIHGNWKLAVDSVCEWYHPPYVHGRFIDPDVAKAEKMVPPVDAYHYDVFPPHMLTSVPGPPPLPRRERATPARRERDQRWVYKLFRAGLFGPDDVPDIGEPPDFLNKGDIASWGNDQFWLFPNLSIQIWARNYYITYTYWPESVDSHIYEIDLYFVPPENASDRLAQELVVDSTIEFAMQDVNTIEATHSALATRAPERVPPERPGAAHPQLPQGHPRHGRRPPGRGGSPMSTLPQGFEDLEPYVADWASPTRAERYETRLAKPSTRLPPSTTRSRPGRGGHRPPRRPRPPTRSRRTRAAAAPAALDDPRVLRGERLPPAADPGRGRRLLRHGRRARRLSSDQSARSGTHRSGDADPGDDPLDAPQTAAGRSGSFRWPCFVPGSISTRHVDAGRLEDAGVRTRRTRAARPPRS